MDKESVSKVLADRVSQELLNSTIPARLAYIGLDGLPRAIPIGFWWDGERIGLATTPNAPKVEALRTNPNVALTIDTETFPPHILLVRGTASLEIVDGVVPEWLEKSKKAMDPAGHADFEKNTRYKQMARIMITPRWAKMMDFERTLPQAVAELVAAQ
jgi:hypothetical protein